MDPKLAINLPGGVSFESGLCLDWYYWQNKIEIGNKREHSQNKFICSHHFEMGKVRKHLSTKLGV